MKPLSVRVDLVNQTLQTPGVDFGQGYKPMPFHWKSPDGRVIVLKIKGHTRWGGIGMARIYESACFLVLRLERTDGGIMQAEEIALFPIKSDPRLEEQK